MNQSPSTPQMNMGEKTAGNGPAFHCGLAILGRCLVSDWEAKEYAERAGLPADLNAGPSWHGLTTLPVRLKVF